MSKLINHLRQKPAHVRRMVAFGTSFVITGFIGLIWVSSLFSGGLDVVASKNDDANKGPSPISVLADQFAEMFRFAGSQLASVGSSFGFAQSSSTESEVKYADTTNKNSVITVQGGGSIGVSTVSNQQ